MPTSGPQHTRWCDQGRDGIGDFGEYGDVGCGTRFTELVGCDWPVQLAAMGGGVGGPELAEAVSRAGGLGMVSWNEEVPGDGCGVNFLVPFLPPRADIVSMARPDGIVEFFYGDPDRDLVALGHQGGSIVGWQVGSASEAASAEAAGCDYIVAQGTEAGGHVRGQQTLDDLLDEVLGRVSVPVVAAGGIATAERVAALVGAGADGVRVGTRFLVCPESRAHEEYVQNLISAEEGDTVLTGWFDLGWPDAPHRVLRHALESAQRGGWREPWPPCRGETRSVGTMAQYAGTGVGHVVAIQPAAEVLADLVRFLDGS
jgi:nitronate monooxygenase